ncbi:thermonuclease family protein [Pelagibius sp. Alg239-R121]|uniref:thermonuclease family protein n=1 Tax=Pelagibius sp. Alg239-R121 TaxID=2993448 RepID=UPI0024A6E92B|nr:thermonuclease family protein [Pelagibius sp. Alg239-R121]
MNRFLVTAVSAVLFLTVAPAFGETITGASRIIDGDSLEVAGQKIDLQGIDAPELEQTCSWPKKEIDCGLIAKSALMDLTAGASVICDVEGLGESGNALGVCRAAGYDIAEGMAHTGWAMATEDAPSRYKKAMLGAQNAGRALWRGRFTSPWVWRANQEEAVK